MIITEIQQKEIEQLMPKHREALVAFGTEMYRRGAIVGAVWITVGIGCGAIVGTLMGMRKYRKSEKENEKES